MSVVAPSAPPERWQRGLKHGGLRIFVCGGRAFPDRDFVFRTLYKIQRKHGVVCVIHGACMQKDPDTGEWVLSGADRWADEWATENRVPCMRFPVTRREWKEKGRRAGPERNTRAIERGVPDLCVHFPGERGTADARQKCFDRGILCFDPITNEVT